MTPFVGRQQVEGDSEDLVVERLQIALEADVPVELVGDAQLLVVAPQVVDVGDLALGTKAGLRLLGSSARTLASTCGAMACTTVTPGPCELAAAGRGGCRAEGEHRAATQTSSPSLSLKRVMRRPLTKVPLEELRSWTHQSRADAADLGMLLGDLAVGELQGVDGMPSDARLLQKLELAGRALGRPDEQARLAGGRLAPDGTSADGADRRRRRWQGGSTVRTERSTLRGKGC